MNHFLDSGSRLQKMTSGPEIMQQTLCFCMSKTSVEVEDIAASWLSEDKTVWCLVSSGREAY
jgi:hypothetical protein